MSVKFIFISKCQILEALINLMLLLNNSKNSKVEEFKLVFIEQIKSNLLEVFKDEIRQIIMEELKETEKLSSTVSLLDKQVNKLSKDNMAFQEKCKSLEYLVECNEQFSRRTCQRISNIPCEKDEVSKKVLEKVKRLVNNAGIDIPDSNIDRVHRIGPKEDKNHCNHCKAHNIKASHVFI